MRIADPEDYLQHFQKRVIQDAWAQASSTYWQRRAAAFEAALPRAGDFTGQASPADLRAQWDRIEATIVACYRRARVSPGGDIT